MTGFTKFFANPVTFLFRSVLIRSVLLSTYY
nr:MAG TPA: hypothetical protein [Bacteriophage sp.]DAZ43403.1 MAG TPA: hypothetical protein [Caudoviricetes sp.]